MSSLEEIANSAVARDEKVPRMLRNARQGTRMIRFDSDAVLGNAQGTCPNEARPFFSLTFPSCRSSISIKRSSVPLMAWVTDGA